MSADRGSAYFARTTSLGKITGEVEEKTWEFLNKVAGRSRVCVPLLNNVTTCGRENWQDRTFLSNVALLGEFSPCASTDVKRLSCGHALVTTKSPHREGCKGVLCQRLGARTSSDVHGCQCYSNVSRMASCFQVSPVDQLFLHDNHTV